jgi:hypothetical protein
MAVHMGESASKSLLVVRLKCKNGHSFFSLNRYLILEIIEHVLAQGYNANRWFANGNFDRVYLIKEIYCGD